MDITIVIRKSLVYTVLIGLFTCAYFLLILALSKLISSIIGRSFVVSAIAIGFLSVFFQPLKDLIQKHIDQVFFRGRFDYQQSLIDLAGSTASIIKLKQLAELVKSSLQKSLNPENISLYILTNSGTYTDQFNPGTSIPGNLDIFEHIIRGKRLFTLTSQSSELHKTEAAILKSQIFIPLIRNDRPIGMLTLGNKKSEEPYNPDDLALLTILGNQLAISIENSILHEKDLEHQKKMIEADKMVSLGTLAAGMAHEIKNPLAMIKSFSQMAKDAFYERDEAFFDKFNQIVPAQLDRLNCLIETLLRFGKPQKPNKIPINLNQAITETLQLFDPQVQKQNITLETNLADIPLIIADKAQIQQVISNLILNALDSMPPQGHLTVLTNTQNNQVHLEIKDSGSGIRTEDIPKIFNPFYSTKEKGTGLGLAVIKHILDEHSAKIKVKSAPGKGTIFEITLTLTQSTNLTHPDI
jgi:signal transduction histidine kinase